MRRLVDVNVWFALLVRQHQHQNTARLWFETLVQGEAGMCRFVQLGLIRLLGNRTILGSDAISAKSAWNLTTTLLEDERVEFLQEPAHIDAYLPAFWNYSIPTGKLVSDAYLCAFAVCGSLTLSTLDAGFNEFRDVQVELLG